MFIKAIYQFLFSTQGFSQQNGMMELTDKDGNKTGYAIIYYDRGYFQNFNISINYDIF